MLISFPTTPAAPAATICRIERGAADMDTQAAVCKRLGFAEQTIPIGATGIKIHYVETGKGKTILFLHGFPEFWYSWKDQLAAFGKHYHAVAMDMRGYNLSDRPANVEDYRIPLLVEDVRALLEHLSHGKRAVLVGHDWGGVIAWAFALAHPDYLDKLIIVNAPHPAIFMRELTTNPDQQKASAYMNFFKSPAAETMLSANHYSALASAVLNSAASPTAFTEEDRRAYVECWSRPGGLTGGLNYYRASGIGPPAGSSGAAPHSDLLAMLPSLEVKPPTLVIWGMKDTALLAGNLNGMEKYVPHLTVKQIAEGSHWVVHEQPEVVNRAIREFLDGKPVE
jgi:pimeloyl-ACP methyl ester carboxylesterase